MNFYTVRKIVSISCMIVALCSSGIATVNSVCMERVDAIPVISRSNTSTTRANISSARYSSVVSYIPSTTILTTVFTTTSTDTANSTLVTTSECTSESNYPISNILDVDTTTVIEPTYSIVSTTVETTSVLETTIPNIEIVTASNTECTINETTVNNLWMSDADINLLATLVYLEAGVESYDCKKAVASTVINRMRISGGSISDVVYEPNQYSIASRLSCTTPSNDAIQAVRDVMQNGTTLPIYVTYFRAGYYHGWGDQTPYCCIGNTYFTYSQAIKNQYT